MFSCARARALAVPCRIGLRARANPVRTQPRPIGYWPPTNGMGPPDLRARGVTADQVAVDGFNLHVQKYIGMSRLVCNPDCCGWVFNGPETRDKILWAAAWSASKLFAEAENLQRLRRRHGDDCAWIFVDTSRNKSRRWCSMAACGNVVKARRHYRKQKTTSK